MNIPVTVEIPDLWGTDKFSRANWGAVNYLVGPNGTGKTRFAEQLKNVVSNAALKPRYLSAERLAGLERLNVMGYGGAFQSGFNVGEYENIKRRGAQEGLAAAAFVILKEKIDVRIRIEAFLSTIFGRRIRFAEEGGYLKPKIQRILGGAEYSMKESECHGLKELITLLAFVYDDEFNALIIDEPELHLHPQFQTFLLSEIRKAAGDPRAATEKKVFFLITHSPYLLDFRTLDDLRNAIIFHHDTAPTYIGTLNSQDEFSLKRLLPRLNTHHKQFFFAHRPIFVEGYTDQQLFSLIQDTREVLLGATGACFIDVNGKDEQDFFFRLCKNLKIDAQFICDLDLITRGSLRNSISEDERCRTFVSNAAIGADLMDAIRQLNVRIDALAKTLESTTEPSLKDVQVAVHEAPDTEAKRYRVLVATLHSKTAFTEALPHQKADIEYIAAKVAAVAQGARSAGVFILPKGALENHLPSYVGSPYQVADKSKFATFEIERDFILAAPDRAAIETRYSSLTPILDAACGASDVNLKRFVGYAIGTFIGNVQFAFERNEIQSLDSLKQHASVEWPTYERIMEIISFDADDGSFVCKAKLRSLVDASQSQFEFSDTTLPSKFSMPSIL